MIARESLVNNVQQVCPVRHRECHQKPSSPRGESPLNRLALWPLNSPVVSFKDIPSRPSLQAERNIRANIPALGRHGDTNRARQMNGRTHANWCPGPVSSSAPRSTSGSNSIRSRFSSSRLTVWGIATRWVDVNWGSLPAPVSFKSLFYLFELGKQDLVWVLTTRGHVNLLTSIVIVD